MATILCQSCKQPMDVPAEMGGQMMACPHCGAQFVAPRSAAPRTPPIRTSSPTMPPAAAQPKPSLPPPSFQPVVAPTPPAPAFMPIAEDASKTFGRPIREQPVTLLDVFDLTFARFVTPIIVKIIWVIILILAGLWLLLITYLLAVSLVATSPASIGGFGGAPRLGTESRLILALMQIVLYLFQVAATGGMLLFWRLVLESLMNLYNIGNSLKSIDRKTRAE